LTIARLPLKLYQHKRPVVDDPELLQTMYSGSDAGGNLPPLAVEEVDVKEEEEAEAEEEGFPMDDLL
jgi:hypothetical protein